MARKLTAKLAESTVAGATPAGPADRILDVAERLAQTRGFNGFSYADVADELGVTKASLHYHFASKADLGGALLDRYQQGFVGALAQIDQQTGDPVDKLRAFLAANPDVAALLK